MKKVPVRETIAFAFTFLFRNIAGILRVSWMSAVISAAVGYFISNFFTAHEAEMNAGNFDALTPILALAMLGALLLALYAAGVAAIGVTRLSFGLPTGSGPLYFPMTRTEWRMFLANLRYLLGVAALVLLAIAVSGAALELADFQTGADAAQQEMTPAKLLALAVSLVLCVYAAVSALRMGFFLPATIAAETRGGIRRSHELTRGNFARIVVVVVAVLSPFILLMEVRGAITTGVLTGPEQPLVSQLFSLVISILLTGLFYSASAYAYRRLTEGNTGGPVSRPDAG